ncbi:hypothetical protein Tco_1352968 [Tanacetum coccineum]
MFYAKICNNDKNLSDNSLEQADKEDELVLAVLRVEELRHECAHWHGRLKNGLLRGRGVVSVFPLEEEVREWLVLARHLIYEGEEE